MTEPETMVTVILDRPYLQIEEDDERRWIVHVNPDRAGWQQVGDPGDPLWRYAFVQLMEEYREMKHLLS